MFILGVSLAFNAIFAFLYFYGKHVEKKHHSDIKEFLATNYTKQNQWTFYDS